MYAQRFQGREREVVEFYQKRFSVSYPNEERPAARPNRTTPMYDTFAGMGARGGLHCVLRGLLPPSERTHMLVDGPVSTLALLRAVAHLETIASQPCGHTADHAHTRKTRAWGWACIFALRDPTLVVHCCQIWSGLRPS